MVPHVLTMVAGQAVKCNNTQFTGTVTSKESETIFFEPQYSGCKLQGTTASSSTNGCDFKLEMVSKSNPPAARMSVECPKDKDIEFVSDSKDCRVLLFGGLGLNTTTFVNEGTGTSKDITASFVVKGLHYQIKGTECVTPGTYTNGEYTGTATLKGYKDEESKKGAQLGIWAA